MKILYVATISDTINAFLVPHIEILLDQGHYVDIACNIQMHLNPRLLERGCKVFNLEFQRSPLAMQNYQSYREMINIITNENYDLVHVHTPVAAACTRLACRKFSNTKVIYTAHGFHFFKGAPIKNWLLYYPIEYILARYTDVLITINKEDYDRARKSLKACKVEYISGVGLNTEKFSNVSVDKLAKRIELNVSPEAYCILSVGELNQNKNHETVIKAIATLNNRNIQYIICGEGPLEDYLKDLAMKLGLEKQVKLLGYRSDIAEIFKVADVFVFPSFREGLPVALMEAMASGLPIICSDIRGNRELIENGKNGYIVESNDSKEISFKINNIYQEIKANEQIRNENQMKVKQFDIKCVINKLQKIYADISF